MQAAIEAQVELQGSGLHSGRKSSVRLLRREGIGSPRFFWLNRSESFSFSDLAGFSRSALRSTILQADDLEIRTVEHLLSASLFFADCPVDIHCDAHEPPGLDGSALPFFQAFAELFPEKSEAPSWREYPSNLRFEHEGPEGSLRVEPSDFFSVEYELDRPPLRQKFHLESPRHAVSEILPARTFIFSHEWDEAKKQGLLKGCGSDSGLLFARSQKEFEWAKVQNSELKGKTFPLLHPESERVDQEPVKHKILDLLGDLALLNLALPRLRILVRNGGHALNHLLLEQLQHERKHSNR